MKRVRPYPFDRLPRLAHNQVEAGRSFRAHLPLSRSAGFADVERGLGGAVTMRLVESFVTRARDLEPLLAGTVVRLAAANERWALVVLARGLAISLAGAALGFSRAGPELPAPRAPTLAERGAIELLVQLLVEDHPVQVVGVVEGEELLGLLATLSDDSLTHVLEARVETKVGSGAARLVVPAALALAVPAVRSRASLLRRRTRLAHATVHAVLELASARLVGARTSDLRVGDVVAFDAPATMKSARLRVARGGYDCTLANERLTITAPYRLYEGAAMSDDASVREDSSTDQLLRELPVEIVCELGRVTMSGRELLELAPGAVIAVQRPLAGPVDLTVGGRLVARGELVDVEGDLGVRLTEVLD
ncbi:MAG: type III secretion system cytoplasmic ring protein SctQ [Polyangia bacterium]